MSFDKMVRLTVRLGNTHYAIKFVVTENLAVEVTIGTKFMNENLIFIMYRKQRVKFR